MMRSIVKKILVSSVHHKEKYSINNTGGTTFDFQKENIFNFFYTLNFRV